MRKGKIRTSFFKTCGWMYFFLSQISFGCSCDAQRFSFFSIHHAPAGSPQALSPCQPQFATPLKLNFRAQHPHKTPSNFTLDAKETRILVWWIPVPNFEGFKFEDHAYRSTQIKSVGNIREGCLLLQGPHFSRCCLQDSTYRIERDALPCRLLGHFYILCAWANGWGAGGLLTWIQITKLYLRVILEHQILF